MAILSNYVRQAKFTDDSDLFLFRALVFKRKSKNHILRNTNKPLSYTRTREIVLNAFKSIGLQKEKFGLHSLRAGGATAAANNGIQDRLFKRHGRWRSETAKDGYVKDSNERLCSVSRSLGL